MKCCLKAVLKERGMSQKELCERIRARPSTICSLCNGTAKMVKLQLIEDICKALECEITDIFKLV